MEVVFEDLISSFIENKVGISSNFLNNVLANHLKDNLILLNTKNLLLAAGTGNNEHINHNLAIRSDVIYWLDKKHNNEFENEFFLLLDQFIKYLNMTCYTGITDYEFHYSLYPKGSFYIKHIDQFKNNSNRTFSMISYLNNNWQDNDGGELLIYNQNEQKIITPTQGKTVLFKSNELPHEVLKTHQTRMSITGWLKKN